MIVPVSILIALGIVLVGNVASVLKLEAGFVATTPFTTCPSKWNLFTCGNWPQLQFPNWGEISKMDPYYI